MDGVLKRLSLCTNTTIQVMTLIATGPMDYIHICDHCKPKLYKTHSSSSSSWAVAVATGWGSAAVSLEARAAGSTGGL